VRVRCETTPSGAAENTVDQYWLKPLQREDVRAYTGVGIGES
jgi:hypothetical protein